MNLTTKAQLLLHLLRFRLTWNRFAPDYRPAGLPEKFISARQAAALVPDGATVMTCGFTGCARVRVFYQSLADAIKRTGHPRGLTWMGISAMGGRSRIPGTIEELDQPGVITRYVGGHLETMKTILRLADSGHVELHNLPQAEMGYLLEAQARGEDSVVTDTGIGTFLDPRVGLGSVVIPGKGQSLITAEGDRLRFTMPKIDLGVFNVPYADREGNVYANHSACLSENKLVVAAAKKNGGRIIAYVGSIIPADPAKVYIPASEIDAIVVNPYNEQMGSIPHRRYWPMFTLGAKVDKPDAVARIQFMNKVMKVTPIRKPPELAVTRVAADLFTHVARPGDHINIGVGLPEEVSRMVVEGGLAGDIHFGTESGVWGGLPCPSAFFGSAICPDKLMHSAEIFHIWEKRLDVTVLGVLEADEEGNVNVSHRGTKPSDFVGAGGFPDLVNYTRSIIFVGSWMAGGQFEVRDGKMVIARRGSHKFMKKVSQITMSGKRALAAGKRVFYVTHVGIFRLTDRGMELVSVMPGIDVKKDILDDCPMKVVLPESGEVPVVRRELMTGEGFRLAWPAGLNS